ncbi:MmgE/PrpD family protein [Ferviditalea candida]|uniref:MmgE/PrpD family protein n=1 Tax=Ferviditalea candida TaxID=3108399 RepID=A0ABU5ZEA1_9BACL|nr:MmgE/PrpD family protein [Paenibacillaceae bacterium T2]
MRLEEAILQIIEQTRFDALTESEIDRIQTLLMHDAAMGSAAGGHPLVLSLIEDADGLLGDNGYTLLGNTQKCLSNDLAVQYNAMAVTVSIREDFVAGTHPGAILFPLLIAESERKTYAFDRRIESAALGLRLARLLNSRLGKALADKGFRATTVIGSIAGAGALAWLKEQSAEYVLKAMSAAASAASGLAYPFQEGSEEWLVQVPIAAQIANIASRNMKSLTYSHDQFLSGTYSLGSFLQMEFDPDMKLDLAQETDLLKIGVKRHPVNSFVQPVIEALLSMIETAVQEIIKVTVKVPVSYPKNAYLTHTGPFERPNLSLLSIPVSSAIAIARGGISYEDFQAANDPEILELAKRFEIIYDSELTSYDVRVTMHLQNGEQSAHVETAQFYPSLEDELKWIQDQHRHVLPWIDKLSKAWME